VTAEENLKEIGAGLETSTKMLVWLARQFVTAAQTAAKLPHALPVRQRWFKNCKTHSCWIWSALIVSDKWRDCEWWTFLCYVLVLRLGNAAWLSITYSWGVILTEKLDDLPIMRYFNVGVHKSLWWLKWCSCARYLWFLSVELAAFHRTDDCNFKVAIFGKFVQPCTNVGSISYIEHYTIQ